MSEAAPHVLEVLQYEPADPRLGRHVLHDSRSLRYQVQAAEPRTFKSVRHKSNIPVLDQGQIGSCTGNAVIHLLAFDQFWSTHNFLSATDNAANQKHAQSVYSDATKIDPWPGSWQPDDTGSNGLSVAKVLKDRGLISGYKHATSLDATLTALMDGPVTVGTAWHEAMYTVEADARIRPLGKELGGHQYVLDELDVARERVWMLNSWGPGWGHSGRAWMTWQDLNTLLSNYGDCTVLVPSTAPEPQPEPVPQKPVDVALYAALVRILDNRTCPSYLRDAAKAWMIGK